MGCSFDTLWYVFHLGQFFMMGEVFSLLAKTKELRMAVHRKGKFYLRGSEAISRTTLNASENRNFPHILVKRKQTVEERNYAELW